MSSDAEVIKELGLFAMKSLITLNGGAIIVLLTFVGNTSADSAFQISLDHLRTSLIMFAIGLAFTGLLVCVSWISVQANSARKEWAWLSDFRAFVLISIAPALLATCFFFLGVGFAISGVTHQ